jgi:hypothetical protein
MKADNYDDAVKIALFQLVVVEKVSFFRFVRQEGLFAFPSQHGNVRLESNESLLGESALNVLKNHR